MVSEAKRFFLGGYEFLIDESIEVEERRFRFMFLVLFTSITKMPGSIDGIPNESLVNGIFFKVSLANRLNQQRTCLRWKTLMPMKDANLKVVQLVEEMIELWHQNDEEKVRNKIFFVVSVHLFF